MVRGVRPLYKRLTRGLGTRVGAWPAGTPPRGPGLCTVVLKSGRVETRMPRSVDWGIAGFIHGWIGPGLLGGGGGCQAPPLPELLSHVRPQSGGYPDAFLV